MRIRLQMRRKCWQRWLHVRRRAASERVRGHVAIERPKGRSTRAGSIEIKRIGREAYSARLRICLNIEVYPTVLDFFFSYVTSLITAE